MTADGDDGREPAPPAVRRRTDRLGDLLPPTTRDESAQGWGGDVDDIDPDDRLRREVPPHHGD
jgi:hypothetical protein